jgi:hypothetical protein
MLPYLALWAVLALGLFTSGCVTLRDPEASLEYTGDVVARLDAANAVGQTFVSRRPRLNGIQLWLRQVAAPSDPAAIVTIELYHAPGEAEPLATIPIRYTSIRRAFPVTIPIPVQDDPPEQRYFLVLKTGDGALEVFGRGEDTYPWGELWVNGLPVAADAAFRASYEYETFALLDDLWRALSGAWLILPMLLALWLPGRLILEVLPPFKRVESGPSQAGLSAYPSANDSLACTLDWGQRTALSVGLSLGFAPLLFLWTTTLGLHWSRIGIGLLYGVMAVALVALLYRHRTGGRPPAFAQVMTKLVARIDWLSLVLGVVFVFSLIVRQVFVRDLANPAWVDPVHHATISRLIVEQGAFPQSYDPYVQSLTSSYHPGFHTVIAVYHWLSGQEIEDAMLLIGQVMNALCVLAVYLFTTTLTKDRLAGVAAALITGALSPMPLYYASWGRYTQLAGLLVLPACLYLIQMIVDHPWPSPKMLYLTSGLACAGLFLTHYRVVIFFGCLLLAVFITETLRSLDKQPVWKSIPFLAGSMGLVALVGILATLPWWPPFIESMIAPSLAQSAPRPEPLTIAWGLLIPGFGRNVLVLAILGLVWSILRARWFGPMLALWVGLLFITANQGSIALPFASGVNKTSVEIMLFMPGAALGGFLAGELLALAAYPLPRIFKRPYWLVIVIGAAILGVSGARRILPLLNPVTVLFRQADRPALTWIADNLPPDASFLINPFLWGYGIYAGQDGGFWITPVTGRQSLPPPVLYGVGKPADRERIIQASRKAIQAGKDPVALHALLEEQGLEYIYVGARGGALSPKALRESPLFETIYAQDGVWIFRARSLP